MFESRSGTKLDGGCVRWSNITHIPTLRTRWGLKRWIRTLASISQLSCLKPAEELIIGSTLWAGVAHHPRGERCSRCRLHRTAHIHVLLQSCGHSALSILQHGVVLYRAG